MYTKKVTMQDIARAAGVSQTAVSMILNQKGTNFPPETVSRVMNIAQELGYVFKRRQDNASRHIIMVIVTTISNPYYTVMLQTLHQIASEQSYQIMVACTYHNPDLENHYLQIAMSDDYLGIIYLHAPDNIKAYDAARKKIPVVALCNRVKYISGDTIQTDNFEAGFAAAQHLLDLGHRHLAVLTGSFGADAGSTSRLNGIYSAMEKNGLMQNLLVLHGPSDWKRILDDHDFYINLGYRLVSSPRIHEEKVTGIICSNDLIAFGAMDYLLSHHYRIPEDYSVIGSDNIRYSSLPQVSLTTINLHMDEIARSAYNTLTSRAVLTQSGTAGASTKLMVQCSVDLIKRDSTAPLKSAYPEEDP